MSLKVKAKELGFYGGILRYEGDVFDVAKESELGRWMEVQSGEDTEEEKPLEDMKAGELIKYAEANGLDIGGLKPQHGAEKILAVVKDALENQG